MRSTVLVLVLAVGVMARGAAADEVAEPAGPGTPAVVLLMPSADAATTQALEEGLRLGLDPEDGGPASLRLVVGRVAGAWEAQASTAAHLLETEDAVAIVSPPERTAAHALAQVATRCGVPLLTTCRAPSVTQAGSTWVFRVVRRGRAAGAETEAPEFDPARPAAAAFVSRFRLRYGRDPDAPAAAGYDAGRALAAARAAGTTRGARLRDALRRLEGIAGADRAIAFDGRGERRDASNGADGGLEGAGR